MNRIRISITGTPIDVRFSADRKDAEMVVLKSLHPEGGTALLAAFGVTPASDVWQGSRYFMVRARLDDFGGGFGDLLSAAVRAEREAMDAEPAALLPVINEEHPCPECGVTDDPHWKFCGVGASVKHLA